MRQLIKGPFVSGTDRVDLGQVQHAAVLHAVKCVETGREGNDVRWEIAVPGAAEGVDREGVLPAQDFDWSVYED